MLHQAQRVSWLVRDRDETHYIHLRMRVRNADTGAQSGGTDKLQAFREFAGRLDLRDRGPQAARVHVDAAGSGAGAAASK